MSNKPYIKVFFTDFWDSLNPHDNVFLTLLQSVAHVSVDAQKPDIVFHSCFGLKHLEYDCVKICYLGENLTPDFNVSDYAMSFDFLDFGDRYFRLPLYRLYMMNKEHQHPELSFFTQEAANKTHFCNFIYSNGRNSSPQRDLFFHQLSTYKAVDSGGKHLNNIGGRVDDKVAWQRKYKFSIAFENSCKAGYATEKIYDALCAHTIPIYWGNPQIDRDFNPKRFINCHDFPSMEAVMEHVRYLDNHDEAYLDMLSQPWFAGETPAKFHEDPELLDFLRNIVTQDVNLAKRCTRHGLSFEHYQQQIFLHKLARPAQIFTKRADIKKRLLHKLCKYFKKP